MTRRFVALAEVVGLPLLDHVVTNGEKYFSFAEIGMVHGQQIDDSIDQRPTRTSKPKLPIVPTPQGPGFGSMADWEAVPAGSSSLPSVARPESAVPYFLALKTADPDHQHVLYLDTRGALRGVERFPLTLTTEQLFLNIMNGCSREGALSFALGLPTGSNVVNEGTGPTPTDDQRRLIRRLRDKTSVVGLQFVDAMTVSGGASYFSFREAGLMEEGAKYGEPADTSATSTAPVDQAAHEAATSPNNPLPEPTQAQKEAGNYKLGHVRISGHEISIENPAGSERKGTDPSGKAWSVTMQDHYGYFKGTNAKDGDHVDVFVKAGTPADYAGPVHVIRQVKPVLGSQFSVSGTANREQRTENSAQRSAKGAFDEYKVLMGYPTAEEARAAYLRNYAKGWQGLDKLTSHTQAEFQVIKDQVFTVPGPVREGDKVLAARAMRSDAPAPPKRPSLLARVGFNGLDRALTTWLGKALTWLGKTSVVGKIQEVGGNVEKPLLETLARYAIEGTLMANPNVKLDAKKLEETRAGMLAQMRRAWMAVKQQVVPDSVLPEDVLAKRREMNVREAVGMEKALDIGKRAFEGKAKLSDLMVPEGMKNPEIKRRIFLAMNPSIPSGVTMESLTPEERAVAEQLKKIRRRLGEEGVKAGRLSYETFEENLDGTSHYYEQDAKAQHGLVKKFVHSVRSILAQRATAWHVVDTATKDKTNQDALVNYTAEGEKRQKWRFTSKAHRDAFYEDFIRQQVVLAKDERFAKKYAWMKDEERQALLNVTQDKLKAPGTLTKHQREVVERLTEVLRRRFQKKEPLDFEQHEKAGLIMDPFYAIARQMAEMTHDNALADFFNHIAANPEYVTDAPIQGYRQVPDSTRFGRLAGLYVRDDIAFEVLQMSEVPNMALQIYDAALSLFKFGHTVLNPGSHMRNVIGNIQFAVLAGSNPLNPGNARYYAQAARTLRDGGAELQELYDQGILGADYLTAEVKRTLRQLLPDPDSILQDAQRGNWTWLVGLKEFIARKLAAAAKVPGSALGSAVTGMENAWRWEDDIYKASAYLKAKAMGLSPADAAEHVRKFFPFYDKGSSGSLKALGRFVFPFLSFKRESLRIAKNAMKERPLATMTTLMLPRALTQLSLTAAEIKIGMFVLGLGLKDDEDKEDILKDMRGQSGKLLGFMDTPITSILLPFRDSNGGLMQFDLTNTSVFSDWIAHRAEMGSENEPWFQRVARDIGSGSPYADLLIEMWQNEDSFTRRRIWEDDMSTWEKGQKMLGQIATTMAPPIMPIVGTSYKTIANSLEQSPSKLMPQRSVTQAVLRAVGGLDVRSADPDLYRKARDYMKEHGLPMGTPSIAWPKDAVGRARAEFYKALIQPQPDIAAAAKSMEILAANGKPIVSMKDVYELFESRAPETIMKQKKHRNSFVNSLPPESGRLMTGAKKERDKAVRNLPGAMAEIRRQQAKGKE